MSNIASVILVALFLSSAPQLAWAQVQELQENVVDDVVVDGRRTLAETVHGFVDDITEPPRGLGPARWERTICVGAGKLQRAAAQVLIDRVSDVASLVGLEAGSPGCRPNILIVAADDADGLADGLVKARPRAFRPGWSGAARSSEALDAFRTSDQPVRWWHVSVPVDRDTGQVAVRLFGEPPPVIAGEGHLRTNITNRLLRTFVILDIPQMENMTFQQLGDYVAMVALAQIDPEADPVGYDSVLNLFNGSPHGVALTEWDTAYLRALYDAELNQKVVGSQFNDVGSTMLRDRRRAETTPNTD